jgi:hypothetical protein
LAPAFFAALFVALALIAISCFLSCYRSCRPAIDPVSSRSIIVDARVQCTELLINFVRRVFAMRPPITVIRGRSGTMSGICPLRPLSPNHADCREPSALSSYRIFALALSANSFVERSRAQRCEMWGVDHHCVDPFHRQHACPDRRHLRCRKRARHFSIRVLHHSAHNSEGPAFRPIILASRPLPGQFGSRGCKRAKWDSCSIIRNGVAIHHRGRWLEAFDR